MSYYTKSHQQQQQHEEDLFDIITTESAETSRITPATASTAATASPYIAITMANETVDDRSKNYDSGAAFTSSYVDNSMNSKNKEINATTLTTPSPTTSSSSPSRLQSFTSLPRFQDRPLWQRFLLTVNVMLCVPMYSMLLCLGVYGLILHFTWHVLWFRTLWLFYLPYCVLDPTPTKKPQHRWFPESWRRWMRHYPGFRWVAQYFPVTLIKTQDLCPHSHRYIFLYHPHGVIGMGANAALNTNGAHFEQVFPGIRRSSVTLNASFWAPLFREWILGIGFISANKTTLLQTLQEESVVLVPGGAAEALHAHPGVSKFYLKHRKGFCRLALETSCPLVPCIGFGENESFSTLYCHDDTPPLPPTEGESSLSSSITTTTSPSVQNMDANHKSTTCHSSSFQPQQRRRRRSCFSLPPVIWRIQQRLLRCLSFSTPILLNPIPRPHPIHVVVGPPVWLLPSQSTSSPSSSSSSRGGGAAATTTAATACTVDELHERYLDAVRTLYEQHKSKFGYHDVPLEII